MLCSCLAIKSQSYYFIDLLRSVYLLLSVILSVDAKAEIADLQMQMESLKEKNAVLEKTNQNVKSSLLEFQCD